MMIYRKSRKVRAFRSWKFHHQPFSIGRDAHNRSDWSVDHLLQCGSILPDAKGKCNVSHEAAKKNVSIGTKHRGITFGIGDLASSDSAVERHEPEPFLSVAIGGNNNLPAVWGNVVCMSRRAIDGKLRQQRFVAAGIEIDNA